MYNTYNPAQPAGLMDFVRAAKACIKELTPAELETRLDSGEDLLLIDVREHSESEQGHIKNSVLVPRGILEAAADPAYPKHFPDLCNARNRNVVVYCATGGRSAMAAAVLQMMGFNKVISLDGGIARWEKEGLPVQRQARYV
ncbi:MAG: rhodanese-like domain-containing protein [Thiohalomonadaceae bacterium]